MFRVVITLTMAFSFNLSAQVDVGSAAIISPAISDSLYANTSVIDVIFSLKNYGDSIKANAADTLWMQIYANGNFFGKIKKKSG